MSCVLILCAACACAACASATSGAPQAEPVPVTMTPTTQRVVVAGGQTLNISTGLVRTKTGS